MKYAFVILVVAVGFWLWQRNRMASRKSDVKPPAENSPVKRPAVLQMVSCSVCGVHLPSIDARIGKHGVYCSEEHQHQVGD